MPLYSNFGGIDRGRDIYEQERNRSRTFTPPAPPPRASDPLQTVLDDSFYPEYNRLQDNQQGIEELFIEMLQSPVNYGDLRSEVSAVGESVVNQLFGAGGDVETAFGEALGQTVETGFGTTSGGFARARQNILGQATEQVTDAVSRAAVDLAPVAAQSRGQDIASLLGFTEFQGGRLDNLRESLFGGATQIEQLDLAQQQAFNNRRLTDQALYERNNQGGGFWDSIGGIAGAAAGSVFGPVGTAVGSKLGGKVTDWLNLS